MKNQLNKPFSTFFVYGVILAVFTSLSIRKAAAQYSIPGLFNTGDDASGALLQEFSVDSHWSGGAVVHSVAGEFRVFPFPPWFDQGPNSQWIAPTADQSVGNSPGLYY